MILVVDASIVVKWFVDEPGTAEALALLSGPDALSAPDFMFVELANVLWKKQRLGDLDRMHLRRILDTTHGSIDELVPQSALLERAVEIACDLDHPVYDCLYVACAEAIGGVFITADRRLLQRIEGSGFAGFVRPLAGVR